MTEKEEEAVRQNLLDAGCEAEDIEKFVSLGEEGKGAEQAALLAEHRARLLRRMHEEQRRIDCLDFLTFKMRKAREKR
ncbi:MAG: hypothetical protein Q4D58_10390 [Synergistaceae bacterium]|nr:hypothetical protein [Synergistaceae bacterium]